MTRAEYEAKYGSPPPVPQKAAPVKMTRAEYEAKYGKPPAASVLPPAGPLDSLKTKLGTRFNTAVNAETSSAAGKLNPLVAGSKIAGAVLGMGNDIIGEGVGAVLSAADAATGRVTSNAIKSASGTQAGKVVLSAIGKGKSAVDKYAADHPNVAGFASPVIEGGQLLLNRAGLGGAKVAATAGKDAAVGTTKTVAKIADGSVPVRRPFASSYDAEAAATFKELGVKPPVSAITKSPFVRSAESVASKSAFGQPIVDSLKTAHDQLIERTTKIVEKIAPEKSVSDENLGKLIQEGFKEYNDKFKVDTEKIYTEFGKQYRGVPAEARGTVGVLQDIVDQQGKDYFRGIDPRLNTMLNKLSGENYSTSALRKAGLPEKVVEASKLQPKLTFEELKATRTSVGEAMIRDPENAALKRLYGALSDDMNATITGHDPAAGKYLKKLNAYYYQQKQKIEGRIAQSIEQSNPERIAQNIIKRNSADTLKVIKEQIGPARFQEVSKAFTRELFDGAKTRGEFDINKLTRRLANYDDATLAEIFTPTQRKMLDEAVAELQKTRKALDYLKPGEKIREGSQTAYLLKVGRIGALGSAILRGSITEILTILGSFAGDYGLTKLVTSEKGRTLLTTGFGSKSTAALPALKAAEKAPEGAFYPHISTAKTNNIKPKNVTMKPKLPRAPRKSRTLPKYEPYKDGEVPF